MWNPITGKTPKVPTLYMHDNACLGFGFSRSVPAMITRWWQLLSSQRPQFIFIALAPALEVASLGIEKVVKRILMDML